MSGNGVWKKNPSKKAPAPVRQASVDRNNGSVIHGSVLMMEMPLKCGRKVHHQPKLWLYGVTIGGCGDAETEGGLWMTDEAEIDSGSQLDGGEGSWGRVGMSNLRLGQCLAWWSGRLQTMQMCSLLQASLLQSSNHGQSSQIW